MTAAPGTGWTRIVKGRGPAIIAVVIIAAVVLIASGKVEAA